MVFIESVKKPSITVFTDCKHAENTFIHLVHRLATLKCDNANKRGVKKLIKTGEEGSHPSSPDIVIAEAEPCTSCSDPR